jgi:hypothetical protein
MTTETYGNHLVPKSEQTCSDAVKIPQAQNSTKCCVEMGENTGRFTMTKHRINDYKSRNNLPITAKLGDTGQEPA